MLASGGWSKPRPSESACVRLIKTMGVQLQNLQVQTCFTVYQKVQLTHKLYLLENARNALNKQLDNLMNKAYEEVREFVNSSFPTTTYTSLTETLDVKCETIEKLSGVLKNFKFASFKDLDKYDDRTLQIKPVRESANLKFGSMLQNMFMTSPIGKAVHLLGARLNFQHFKQLVIPLKGTHEVKDATCSAPSNHNRTGQDSEILGKSEQNDVEKCSSRKEILLPASCEIVKTNAHKLLLPPVPVILDKIGCNGPYLGVPMAKWGREDDIQVQHQKQTSTQLLHFLKVKAKSTGALNVTVMEWHNSLSGLPPPSPAQNITKRAYQFKQDATWPSGMLSETENHTPLFKVKRVNSGGSLTYTCVIATKTELWDMGDIVTDLDSESSSVSSEETTQVMPSDETLKWIDATVQKYDATSAKMHTVNAVTIPEFQSKRFEEIEVVVSHIVNPGNFYIQHSDATEKLLTLFSAGREENSTLGEQNCIPDIGTKVMGWFPQQKQWCRSLVTKICGVSKDDLDTSTKEMSIHLEVKRLDYGDFSCLSLSNIKEMTSEMAVLPLQAVQVSLAHVSPVNGSDWSDEAVGWFRHMVQKRILYARLYPEGPRILVDLFLEKGKIQAMRRGAPLSLRLTQNGHAKHAKLKNSVGTVHLKMKKKDEWEKYLISCYTQRNVRPLA